MLELLESPAMILLYVAILGAIVNAISRPLVARFPALGPYARAALDALPNVVGALMTIITKRPLDPPVPPIWPPADDDDGDAEALPPPAAPPARARSRASTVLRLLSCLTLAAACAGCAGNQSQLDAAVQVLNSTQVLLVEANATIAVLHRRARDAAVDAAASADAARKALPAVHKRFAPAWRAYERARALWLAAAASTRAAMAAEAAQQRPDVARVLASLAALSAACVALEDAARALAAPVASDWFYAPPVSRYA